MHKLWPMWRFISVVLLLSNNVDVNVVIVIFVLTYILFLSAIFSESLFYRFHMFSLTVYFSYYSAFNGTDSQDFYSNYDTFDYVI